MNPIFITKVPIFIFKGNLFTECPKFDTISFAGDLEGELIRELTENFGKKILRFKNSIGQFPENPNDLLIIFINKLDINYIKKLFNPLTNINTVFVLIKENNLSYDQMMNIFDYFWNTSEASQVVICIESKNSLKLFTYNPFNDYAPVFWTKYKKNNNNRIYYGHFSKIKIGKNHLITDF